ncbi:PREDICTED: probable E3 ubiquitin-protein ligase makorin-1 isoform X2 [Ceratosolen solmsi marchali]|uniref:RING-type E3 ubiquitin transferase n=1 Tax=Ceratosolen solmsi marchali TaxID=326594 RepID=A0AAJ6YGN6_9HYME|nr:PREDICTED: probable E3 ubiquitin-protein ligase makorin-1 isoform X2 [Ceratosolen solmsi marchali]
MADNSTCYNVVCRYFKKGICREGSKCRYKHMEVVRNETAPSESGSSQDSSASYVNIECYYFKRGNCRFGNNCGFAHNPDNYLEESDSDASTNGSLSNKNLVAAEEWVKAPEFVPSSINFNVNVPFSMEDFASATHPKSYAQAVNPSSGQSTFSANDPLCLSFCTTVNCPNLHGDICDMCGLRNLHPYNEDLRKMHISTCSMENHEFNMTFKFDTQPSRELTFSLENYASAKTPMSYTRAVNSSSGQSTFTADDPLCPSFCTTVNCPNLHGDICDMCGKRNLHPYNEDLRKLHISACMEEHKIDMELSFAIQRSREKSCGVCFETIMEKSKGEQRFGILPNCNHCFCLTCIRKWRQSKQFDNKIIRACPECRVPSDFVCPSMYWVDTKDEKDKLIMDYKDALSTKDCKYFNKGRGNCPFGNKCFYLHALPDGTKADVGPPIRQRRNADNDIDVFHQLLLWDFMDERDNFWMYDFDDLRDFVNIVSDSDDSDLSEYDLYFD